MEEKFVGIDFGACNIKTARWRNNKASIFSLSKDPDRNYIPNLILYDMTRKGDIEQKVGDPASDGGGDPINSVEYVKRKLELETWSKFIPNLKREVSAVDATTDIFRGLSKHLQAKLNCEPHELRAVITVPVCSSGLQRSRIFKAAKNAGISVEAVITEPFAAMFSIRDLFKGEDDHTVLIFDFGGSTLDLSLLQVEHDDGIHIEELASAGLPYGGIDIDELIFSEIFSKKYATEVKEIQANDDLNNICDHAVANRDLRSVATKLKENLFDEDNDSVTHTLIARNGKHYSFELTRQEMYNLFERHNLRGKIFGLLDELFSQTCLTKSEVTQVKTFGGTSRIKYVLDLLTEYFGKDIFDSDDYEWEDESITDVAIGAVYYLNIRKEPNSEIEFVNNIPFSIGIAKGKTFKKYLDCCPPYGQRTKRIPLPWRELNANGNKVAVYQSFADSENVEVGGKNGAVYIGSAAVNPSLYKSQDGILLEMELVDSDTLKMIFTELIEGNLVEVETQIINLCETTTD